ncbi:MAG TPA: aldo/keto reductase, partial [Daejeonella sp.]|nr:aldo/keto reductase [Daejeonella sp.]
INSFDTAAVYGDGSSERIIGQWMVERAISSDSISIATKILPPYDPLHIRITVEQCLRRLGIESIDILYLHRWDEKVTNEQTWSELTDLVSEGKIKELGVSNFNAMQLADTVNLIEKLEGVNLSYIQNNHNLAVSDLNDNMRGICRKNNLKIITYSPLGAGFLTGKHLNGVQKDSRFAVIPAHQDIYFNADSQRRLKRLMEVAADTGYSPEYLALAWATHQKDIDLVLIGGRSTDHIKQAIEASKFYSAEIFDELEKT